MPIPSAPGHPHRVLVVDDDEVARAVLAGYLEKQGFRVALAGESAAMRRELGRGDIDLVLLDINLPGDDGLSLTRELRARSNIPIILITAREGEADRIIGLELGADDYVSKGISTLELLARIRTVLRRAEAFGGGAPDAILAFDGWTMDLERRRLSAPDGREVHLTRSEFDLLATLVRGRGRVISRDRLLDAIGDRTWTSVDRTVDVLVGRLRRKIEDEPGAPRRLITVHGVGYKFIAALPAEPA